MSRQACSAGIGAVVLHWAQMGSEGLQHCWESAAACTADEGPLDCADSSAHVGVHQVCVEELACVHQVGVLIPCRQVGGVQAVRRHKGLRHDSKPSEDSAMSAAWLAYRHDGLYQFDTTAW